ncbi:MAG: Uma2 family endonuclease [Planctomycetota bacterium]
MVTSTETRYTVADYMRLPEGFPAELIDGCLVKEPAPTWWHQDLAVEILLLLRAIVGRGRVVTSPVDVLVDEHNVLQPDVMALAETDRIAPGGDQRAIPILVVEVLSPSTAERDRAQKARIYLGAGVREVWLVDPDGETVEVRTSEGSIVVAEAEEATSEVVRGFALRPTELFGHRPS